MNDDWLKQIQRSMSNYETDAPPGLWHDIETRLPDGRTPRRHVPVWLRLSGAAAAVAALILAIALLLPVSSPLPDAQTGTPVLSDATSHATSDPDRLPDTPLTDTDETHPAAAPSIRTIPEAVQAIPSPETSAETVADTTSTSAPAADTQTSPADASTPASSHANPPRRTSGRDNYRPYSPRPVRQSGRVTLAMYASGGSASSISHTTIADLSGNSPAGIGPDNAEWNDRPMLGINTFNHGLDTKTSVSHRLPLRAGFTVAYRLNSRIAIESGIAYTMLTSDISEGSALHYYSGTQRLHYIGVPLRINCRIASWRRLDFYAAAGFMAEKCVSAKTDKRYVIDGATAATETERFHIRPLQWSANATVGLQLNILPSLGIYVEPGVSYHFDNGTPVATVYNDRPLNLSLDLGLRLTLPR